PFLGKSKLVVDGLFQSSLQSPELLESFFDTDPQRTRMIRVRKRAGAAEAEIEGLELRGNFLREAAERDDLVARDFAEELEREVHLLRRHPVHIRAGRLELLDQFASSVLDPRRKLNGNECADAAQVVA